ncbi:hypothetical protein NFI96_017664, partial [Prochilodus magdalenae]
MWLHPETGPVHAVEVTGDSHHKMFNRKTKPVSYFFDMTHLSNYWGNDGKPARDYHHTGPVSGFFTLRESLAILAEKASFIAVVTTQSRSGTGYLKKAGLENSWRHHKEVAEYLWKGIEDLGLELFIKDKDLRLPSVTTIAIPDGYNWKELLTYMMKHHQIEITGGLGPSIGMVRNLTSLFHL